MATLRHPIFLSFLGGALFALGAYGEAASSIQDAPVLVKAKTMFSLGELGPIEPDVIRAAVRTTLEKVKEQLGTNKPVVYLVCDTLNNPNVVSAELTRKLDSVPFAGISLKWIEGLPFERSQLLQDSANARGIQIAALVGAVRVDFREIPELLLTDSLPPFRDPHYQDLFKKHAAELRPKASGFVRQFVEDYSKDAAVFQIRPDVPIPYVIIEADLNKELRQSIFDTRTRFNLYGAKTSYYLKGEVRERGTPLMILSELEVSEEKRKALFHSIQDFYDLSLTPLEQLSALVGEPTLRILSRADRVETFRIEKNLHLDELFEGTDDKSQEEVDRTVAERRKKFPEIEGYDLVKAGPVQNNDFARRLLNGLASEGASLVWTDCGFSPVVLFRAWADKESTNLLVCFGCYQIAVLTRDTNGKTVAADFSSFHLFPKGESVFRKLGLESFPNDPVLLSVR